MRLKKTICVRPQLREKCFFGLYTYCTNAKFMIKTTTTKTKTDTLECIVVSRNWDYCLFSFTLNGKIVGVHVQAFSMSSRLLLILALVFQFSKTLLTKQALLKCSQITANYVWTLNKTFPISLISFQKMVVVYPNNLLSDCPNL